MQNIINIILVISVIYILYRLPSVEKMSNVDKATEEKIREMKIIRKSSNEDFLFSHLYLRDFS